MRPWSPKPPKKPPLTIRKTHTPYNSGFLGLRSYQVSIVADKVSAVVAELVANCYAADAENVLVQLPLSTLLAKRGNGGDDANGNHYTIEVIDDGHGMTPQEAIDFYLKVGRDRRRATPGGGLSRKKKRPVMGRKGIGKLAPFGDLPPDGDHLGRRSKTKDGYLVAHFFLDYDELLKDEETAVPIRAGGLDGTYQKTSGTTVRTLQTSPQACAGCRYLSPSAGDAVRLRQP